MKNAVIEVFWSPQFCLQTRIQNLNSLLKTKKEKNIPLYNRLSTYDGSLQNCTIEGVKSPLLMVDLEKICINIVRHLQCVSSGNVQIFEMRLIFKLGYGDELWLLGCKDIKLKTMNNQVVLVLIRN